MNNIDPQLLQNGALGIILIFAIKEFFSWLRIRKMNNTNGTPLKVLKELQLLNTNHLHDLKETIEKGNKDLTESIHRDNIKIIEILGKIEGKLDR